MLSIDRRSFVVAAGAGVVALSCNDASGRPTAALDTDVQTFRFAEPAGSGEPLLLDLYRPVRSGEPLPVIVFVHGGAFLLGDRKTAPDLHRYFARLGFAMASIEYRRAPKSLFPANIEDLRTSIRWLRANAEQLNLDPSLIGVWGTSAGAYLANMAGVLPPGVHEGKELPDQSSAVACVLSAYGLSDFLVSDRQLAEEKRGLNPVLEPVRNLPKTWVEDEQSITPEIRAIISRGPSGPAEAYFGSPINQIEEKVNAASPIPYVSSKSPPFLIMHGLADGVVPHGQSVLLYEALANANADTTLALVGGLPHTFFNLAGIDDLGVGFRMAIRRRRPDEDEVRSIEEGKVFDVALRFFTTHLRHDYRS